MSFRKKAEYAQKLLDPRWIARRNEILRRDNFTCRECGERNLILNVHHEHYFDNAEPWEYEDEYLTTLCVICHDYRHGTFSKHDKPVTQEFIETELRFLNAQKFEYSETTTMHLYLGPISKFADRNLLINFIRHERGTSVHLETIDLKKWKTDDTYEAMRPCVGFHDNLYGQHQTKKIIRNLMP